MIKSQSNVNLEDIADEVIFVLDMEVAGSALVQGS